MGENNFRVGDVVVIAKEPCDMRNYGKVQEAQKSLKIGSIGAVQAISQADCLVNFEQINGAMRSWYVHHSCLNILSFISLAFISCSFNKDISTIQNQRFSLISAIFCNPALSSTIIYTPVQCYYRKAV